MSPSDPPAARPALDALPCGFLQLDAEDRVVQWNQRLERWTRVPRGLALGRTLTKLFPASHELSRVLAETRTQGRPRVLAQQFHRWLIPVPLPSGHISGLADMQQECHLVPLAEPAGHLAITILDVTPLLIGQRRSQALVAELTDARDRAETALRTQAEGEAQLLNYRDRLELALDAANTCTWESDVSGNVLRLDARWSLMLGGEARTTTSHPFAAIKLVHPADRAATLRHYRECHAGPTNHYRIEQRVRTLQGAWIWILSVQA